jgi:hypothetical protein
MAKKRAAARKSNRTIVERFFLPAIQHAEKILAEADLPDVNHYVRFHNAEDRWTDDLASITDLQPGQTGTAGSDLAARMFGVGSEQEYAARIIGEYRALCINIQRGEQEMATYLAARLGILITEYELEPEVNARGRSLQAATLTRQQRAREAEAQARALGQQIKDSNPHLSTVRIATLVRTEMERSGNADYLPSERTIRRYLKAK